MEFSANYTETLSELLVHQKYGEVEQSASLTRIINEMHKFPAFVFSGTRTVNFLNYFMEKFDHREIGAETEELFMHFWLEKVIEMQIKYIPKIETWLENFRDLFKFTVKLTVNDDTSYNDNKENRYYLNPVNGNAERLKVQDVDNSSDNGNRSRTIERDVLQSVWGKTRAALLQQIMELTDIYNQCIDEFEKIFLGVF